MAEVAGWPGGRAPLLITCVGVESDLDLLPHFLAHYRKLGIAPEDMRVILNARDPDAPGLRDACAILDAAGVPGAETWIAAYTSASMWEKRREVQASEVEADGWVLSADVDEFHDYPEPLPAFLARCETMGVDCVQGVFIDRLAPGGRLAQVAPQPDVLAQFPVEAEVGWSIAGEGAAHDRFGTVKVMALRSGILPSRGGHHPLASQRASYLYGHPLGGFPALEEPSFRFAVPTRVHHVHWTESLPDRLERRLTTPGVSPAGAEYGRKQLDHVAAHGGIALDRVALAPPPPATPWQDRLASLRRRGLWRTRLAPALRVANRLRGR